METLVVINATIQFLVIFIGIICLFLTVYIYNYNFVESWIWNWNILIVNMRDCLLMLIIISCFTWMYLIYNLQYVHSLAYNLLNMLCSDDYVLFLSTTSFSANEISVIFISLVGFLLFPVIVIMDLEFSTSYHNYVIYMIWLYLNIILFIFTSDLLVFYVTYELMVGLVFFIMYLTANSSGGVEAIIFFIGWAILGSILVGIGVIYIISVSQSYGFSEIFFFEFSDNELYYLYILFFIGFGAKLSLWPLWYWLPSAHVEVSTGMSIFLSCILINVCLYGLVSVFYMLNGELCLFPFLFLVILGVLDVSFSLIGQSDLNAVTAYGSVLHVNILAILFLLDTVCLSNGFLYYIWGHSFATAGVFFIINLVESCFGTRLTYELSGIYTVNPIISVFTLLAVITFLEFPLSFFFWGELWVWVLVIDIIPTGGFILMFICVVIYLIIFFSIWWGIIFGSISALGFLPRNGTNWDELFMVIYLVGSQYLIGLQPSILGWIAIG